MSETEEEPPEDDDMEEAIDEVMALLERQKQGKRAFMQSTASV
jgi:hypothetical protein